jgi:hypothetical protein
VKRNLIILFSAGMRNRRLFGRSTWWLWLVVPVPFSLYEVVFDSWRADVWWPKAIEQVSEAVEP